MSMKFRKLVEEEGVEPSYENARESARLYCDPAKSRTKQGDARAADINVIVRQYLAQGVLPEQRVMPQFADISELGSLQDALQVVMEAGEFFMSLPSTAREKFRNEPSVFLAATHDPSYEDLFVELGLLPKKEAPPGGGASGTVST